MSKAELQRQILNDLASFQHDPFGFVMWAFPWGVEGTSLCDETGPDIWQQQQLERIGASLANDPHQIIQEAVASGHGIGKSTEVAWLILWAVMTFPDARGVVTANTDTQLRTKTWPEVSKWFALIRLPELKEMFDLQATSICSTSPGHDKNWRCDAIPWSERNTEAFAGLHNAGRRTFLLFDEASAIIDRIWEVAEGALTDADTEMLWLVFGNPTRNTGRFRECFGRYRNSWTNQQIDSRKVKRTNKKRLDEIVATYGIGNDIVKVRVLGQFPSASSMQFIAVEDVDAAMARPLGQTLGTEPVIFGVDCARFGDDHSTLAVRCGRDARSRPWKRWYHMDSMTIASDIALESAKWKPDAIFVDAGNIGAAIIDRLRQLMPDMLVAEVWFGSTKVGDANWIGASRIRVANKRSEIWTNMRHWLATGSLEDHQGLRDDLIGVEYGFGGEGGDAIMLEKKKDMKARGLASPDDADALACTFAEPVQPRALPTYLDPAAYGKDSFDRYAELG